jgi:hypothetical protein
MNNHRRQLAAFFVRNGVVRLPNQERRASESRQYHKGYEVRLVASSQRELEAIRALLRQEGFGLAEPFTKVNRHIQPLYGKRVVDRFLKLVRDVLADLTTGSPEAASTRKARPNRATRQKTAPGSAP